MRRVKKGMTLLEVVIALGIMAIMIGPLMSSLLTAVQANKKGEEVQDAKLLGQQIVEKLRLTDDIKAGTLTLDDITLNLGAFEAAASTGTEGYFPVTSSEIDGYQVSGKIHQKDVKVVNDDTYLTKDIDLLLVIFNGKIYTAKSSSTKNIINHITNQEDFQSLGIGIGTEDLTFEVLEGIVEGKYKLSIKRLDNEIMNIDDLQGGDIGIYRADSSSAKISIENKTKKVINTYVYKHTNLGEGLFEVNTKGSEAINFYNNIVFDYNLNRNKGLYSVELELKKDGKFVEKIESQFYLGEG